MGIMTPRSIIKSAISHCVPLGLLSRLSTPVLTYHACYEAIPASVAPIDNVSPQRLYDQLHRLKQAFQFLPIDELCKVKRRRGLAAVTFDDGYKSVIERALPIMSALEIPFTVFVNTSALNHKVFWRHKLIYMIENGLTGDLGESMTSPEGLYRAWKDPSRHSRVLEEKLDRVLLARNITLPNHLFEDRSYFVQHPLLWYGNHSHSHYVLSSLSRAEQLEEIRKTQEVLEGIHGIQISQVFSLPFGCTHHANADTYSVLGELGYRAIALGRGGVNWDRRREVDGITVIERLSPNEQDIRWLLPLAFASGIGQTLPGRA